MRQINQIRHYAGALLRGLVNGRLLRVASVYLQHRRIENKAIQKLGLIVRSGPFAKMQYIRTPARHNLISKLLGIYEQEIHPFVEKAVAAAPMTILNVGSAEGYYAVGMALRLPQAQIYAYDIDPRARDLCTTLSGANNIGSRLHIEALCDIDELNKRITGTTLIIMDCEGCERELLDPERVQKLDQTIILLEVHDYPGIHNGELIKTRFAQTHTLSRIGSISPDPALHPEINFLTPADQDAALIERGSPQDWYYLVPKVSALR